MNTTCSTSLVTVHAACQSLRNGECEMALAGGVSFMSTQAASGYLYEDGQIASPDGYCRAFSDDANGVVFGSGVGLVVLKPLDAALRDKDTIHAVIKGIAINNDGREKIGYTAPGMHGQAKVIAAALNQAGVTPERIQYVEAHGTGTNLGDPIEFAALRHVFGGVREDRSQVALGSIKSNIGHLDCAAGVTGLIKVVQALKHRQMPASLHVSTPNRNIDFAGSPFFVNTQLRPWNKGALPRMAGVSSFGVGGTNAHAIVEEAPPVTAGNGDDQPEMLLWSARSISALRAQATNLADHLERHPGLRMADVAHTLQTGRGAHRYRAFVPCSTLAEAVTALRDKKSHTVNEVPAGGNAGVVFLFPGQGAQRPGCTVQLYRHNLAYRKAFDQCADLVRSYIGVDLREVLHQDAGNGNDLDQTALTQPFLFSIEYALAQYWLSLGIKPAAMFGHSLGEYVAACLAGVFNLEEALSLVVVRGQLVQSLAGGAMLAIGAPAAALEGMLCQHGCDLAAVNGPTQCVAAGTHDAIDGLRSALEAEEIPCSRLKTSHAFHSAMLDEIVDTFEQCVAQVKLAPAAIPFITCLTGDWISDDQATSPRHWARHLRETVRFADGMATLQRLDDCLLLEVGPGDTLCKLAKANGVAVERTVTSLSRERMGGELRDMQAVAAELWGKGVPLAWHGLRAGPAGRVPLPTYPFERQRYWIDFAGHRPSPTHAVSPAQAEVAQPLSESSHARPALRTGWVAPSNEIEATLAELWKEHLGIDQIGVNDNFFDLGGDSLTATRLYARIKKLYGVELPRQKVFELATIKRLYLFILTSRDVDAINSLSEEELSEFQAVIES